MYKLTNLVVLNVFISICYCYILVTDQKNQADAEDYCVKQFNSHLATITSSVENSIAYNMVIQKETLLGLNDIMNEGNYVWSDGSTSTYRNWAPNEPNNWDNEDCVILYGPTQPTDKSKWHDTDCITSPTKDFLCNDMVSSCLETNNIGKVNWDQLLTNKSYDKPHLNITKFELDSSDLSLNIEIELEYLQNSTYWLDFQSFNGNNMNKIHEPGSCGNRLSSSYYINQTLRDFGEWWLFSKRPYNDGQLGTDIHLAYPTPGNMWNISTVTGDFATKCSRIKYNSLFSWSQLLSCDGIGNTIKVNEDNNFINLTGIFYVDIISPLDTAYDSGYYKVYELFSQPFSMSLQKTAHVLASIGLNLFDIYLLSIFSENENGDFVINVITESVEYIYLNQATLINYPSHLLNVQSINYSYNSITTSCINGINNICRQIFQINVEFGENYCTINNETNYDLSGLYTFLFNINCGNSSNCNQYVTQYGSNAILSFNAVYIDQTCNVIKPLNISTFSAEMRFYTNTNYDNYTNKSILYDHGDTVYVEIEAMNLRPQIFDYISLSLVNVWICQYDNDLGALPDPGRNIFDGGCLANSTFDFNLYYRIYPTLLFDTMLNEENITNIIRFSFLIPDVDSENRDKLFIHAEVEISLFLSNNSNPARRRTLLVNFENNVKNNHFVQIGDSITITPSVQKQNPNINDKDESLMIIVIVILSGLILVLICLLAMLFYKKTKQSKKENQNNTQKSNDIAIQMQTNEFIE